MQPHRVISAFRHAGQLIEPPCMWTPPSVAVAEKLVCAGCLRATTMGPPGQLGVQAAEKIAGIAANAVEITVNGDSFSREQVMRLADEINEAVAGKGDEPPPPDPKSRRRKK